VVEKCNFCEEKAQPGILRLRSGLRRQRPDLLEIWKSPVGSPAPPDRRFCHPAKTATVQDHKCIIFMRMHAGKSFDRKPPIRDLDGIAARFHGNRLFSFYLRQFGLRSGHHRHDRDVSWGLYIAQFTFFVGMRLGGDAGAALLLHDYKVSAR